MITKEEREKLIADINKRAEDWINDKEDDTPIAFENKQQEMTSKSVQKRINIQQGKPMDAPPTKFKTVVRSIPHVGDIEICEPVTDENIQQETITWHKYPEEKPTETGNYMIQYKDRTNQSNFDGQLWNSGHWIMLPMSWVVIAWSDEPKGWQE